MIHMYAYQLAWIHSTKLYKTILHVLLISSKMTKIKWIIDHTSRPEILLLRTEINNFIFYLNSILHYIINAFEWQKIYHEMCKTMIYFSRNFLWKTNWSTGIVIQFGNAFMVHSKAGVICNSIRNSNYYFFRSISISNSNSI